MLTAADQEFIVQKSVTIGEPAFIMVNGTEVGKIFEFDQPVRDGYYHVIDTVLVV